MTKTKIVNCHQASIVRDPTDPELLEEVIVTLNVGATIFVDFNNIVFSWKDKEYVKCSYGMNTEEGYIRKELVERK